MAEQSLAFRLNQTLHSLMEQDDTLYLLGQDVGVFGGRKFITRGLQERFKGRILETPLNEELMVGIAIGMAVAGLRPIVEYVHGTFLLAAANDVHRASFLAGQNAGFFSLPIVMRVLFGGGYDNYGIELGSSPISFFLNLPCIAIVCPSDGDTAEALLRKALTSNKPTIFLEHRALLEQNESLATPPDEFAPRVVKKGSEITVLGYGYLSWLGREAAQRLVAQNISVEVIDLLVLQPLQEEVILRSAAKTNRVLILDEEPTARNGGLPAMLISRILMRLPRTKVAVLGARDIPLLGRFSLPTVESITKAIEKLYAA